MTTPFLSLLRFAGWLLVAAVLNTLLVLPAAAQGPSPATAKLDAGLRGRAQQLTGRSRIIVQYHGTPDVRAITDSRGRAGRRLGAQRGQVAVLDNRMLATLAADPRVARIMWDRPVFATMERTGTAVGATSLPRQLKLTGAGIGVAVIDSGITSWHDDLEQRTGRPGSRVVHFKDFTREENPNVWMSERPSDDFGHGTHVAGIIAGSGWSSHGARTGLATGAHLLGLKVLDGQGHGFVSDVIAAIDYAVSVSKTYNVRIINLSVASGVFESHDVDPLTLAARRAVDAGIVVVAAAGNLGTAADGELQFGGITSPGNAPWVLTVGAASHQGTAHRRDDTIGRFSSRGPTWIDFAAKPDIVAPGVGIESLSDPQSLLYSTQSQYLLDGTRKTGDKPYLSLSGTSMAAPVVTGAVALMLEANPALTPNAVKALLQYTAEVRPGEHLLAQGAGLLNASGAVRLARFFAAPNSNLGVMADTIEGDTIPWSRHILWGNYRLTGGVPLPGSNAWDPALTWGALATADGEPVVWGAEQLDNIVWSTTRRDNIVWGTARHNNIVWSTKRFDNIVWSTSGPDNIVWSTAGPDNIVWSTAGFDNIVWSTARRDNIVWGTRRFDNIVWGTTCGGGDCEQIVWGASDNVIWSTARHNNIVWSTARRDNIVWSTGSSDDIVWSTGTADPILWPTPDHLRRPDAAGR